jgi:hypothetical protein
MEHTVTKTNSHGFPIVECYRCGGTGRFGPDTVEGGVCFGCRGAKTVVLRGKAAKAWAAFLKAQPSRTVVADELKIGDLVVSDLTHRKTQDNHWVQVTDIELTEQTCGSSLTGTDEANRIHYYYRVITTEEGFSRKLGRSLVRRRVTAEMLPDPRAFWA